MTSRHRRLMAALLLAVAALGSHPARAAIESMAWLAGCWAAEGQDPGSGEHWTPPAGGTMLGLSRTIKGGRTVGHEFMQLHLGPGGQLVFTALPSGQKQTSFTAVSQAEGTVTFENLEHDFPQRVIYTRLPDERLVARIEGTRSGQPRSISFPMRRTVCDAPESKVR